MHQLTYSLDSAGEKAFLSSGSNGEVLLVNVKSYIEMLEEVAVRIIQKAIRQIHIVPFCTKVYLKPLAQDIIRHQIPYSGRMCQKYHHMFTMLSALSSRYLPATF